MATDPRKLRPGELCRLLNSTPLGEVTNDRQVYRLRSRFGLLIGDGQHVDLLRLIAKLVELRHSTKPQPDGGPYEKLKERARARNAAIALAGRDIGKLPEVVNAERKAQAATDFRFFCESYFPLTFHLPWSPDHLKVIAKIEQAVLRGGLFAMAMPRGSGKTTICECACIWAVLNGHRDFVCLIGSDEGHAMDMLDSIKMELDGNDLLLDDFPEVVYPIQALDGIANRCNGQLYKGERTHIGWTAREIVLPTTQPAGWDGDDRLRPFVRPDGYSLGSGAIIKVAGITGLLQKKEAASGLPLTALFAAIMAGHRTDQQARQFGDRPTRLMRSILKDTLQEYGQSSGNYRLLYLLSRFEGFRSNQPMPSRRQPVPQPVPTPPSPKERDYRSIAAVVAKFTRPVGTADLGHYRRRWLDYLPRDPTSPHRNRLEEVLAQMVQDRVLTVTRTPSGAVAYSPGQHFAAYAQG